MRLRPLGERLAREVAAHAGLQLLPSEKQHDRIGDLRSRGRLHRDVANLFHGLRKAGNRALHGGVGSAGDALQQLEMTRRQSPAVLTTLGKLPSGFKPGAFVPPATPKDATNELTAELGQLRQAAEKAAEGHTGTLSALEFERELREDCERQLASLRAQVVETEAAFDELAAARDEEMAALRASIAAQPAAAQQAGVQQLVTQATRAGADLDLTEAETRELSDLQLREAGWQADTVHLRRSRGARPQEGRSVAVAEWPTANGPADYALFVDPRMIASVEAKHVRGSVVGALEQSTRYARGVTFDGGVEAAGVPWREYRVPFLFATNGRPFLKQIIDESGIWFLDARRSTNLPRALVGWHSPDGLSKLLAQDHEAAHAIEDFLEPLRQASTADAAELFLEHVELAPFLDRKFPQDDRSFISKHEDEVVEVVRGYGTDADGNPRTRPEECLDAFAEYRAHTNEVPALALVTQRPRELNRARLEALELALDEAGYDESSLRTAWRQTSNVDIAAAILGYIRQAALGDALVPYPDRVERALTAILSSRAWDVHQRKWLKRIAEQMKASTVVDRAGLDLRPFSVHGGFKRLNKLLEGPLDEVLGEMAEQVWKVGVTSFWRRQAIQSELMRGAAIRSAQGFFGEVNPGRIADSAVFECGPCGGRVSTPLRPVRLHVQARVGVAVLVRRVLRPSGQVQEMLWDNLISLGARGGHEDQSYQWVQIYSESPERIVDLSGSTPEEDIHWNLEGPCVGGLDNQFSWAGRTWFVDNDQTHSARYPLAQPTLGSPRCETTYDHPSSEIQIRSYLEGNPTVGQVTKTTRFHSFLYELPLLRAERQSVFLPRLNPSASVAWTYDEVLGRRAAGGHIEVRQQPYRVHFIHPNGVVPPGMTRVLWRVFHGR